LSSQVDICNLALAHLGDEAQVASIVPTDGTIQSAHCARFYPIARSLLLEMHPWTFATKRVALAEVTNPVPDDWSYAYALPSTCIRPLSALYPGTPERYFGGTDTDAGTFPYLVEAAEDGSLILYTNVEAAYLRYIDLITDSTKYTPAFVTCLARLLASYLAGPVLKGDSGIKMAERQMGIFAREYAVATVRNANTGKRDMRQSYQPSWLAARGITSIPDARVLPSS
jgi:hypothetical protein